MMLNVAEDFSVAAVVSSLNVLALANEVLPLASLLTALTGIVPSPNLLISALVKLTTNALPVPVTSFVTVFLSWVSVMMAW